MLALSLAQSTNSAPVPTVAFDGLIWRWYISVGLNTYQLGVLMVRLPGMGCTALAALHDRVAGMAEKLT